VVVPVNPFNPPKSWSIEKINGIELKGYLNDVLQIEIEMEIICNLFRTHCIYEGVAPANL